VGDSSGGQKRLGQFLRWLGIVVAVLAILTFFGVANYRQLSSALDLDSAPSALHLSDKADAGECAAAQAIITKVNTDPPVGVTASMHFYLSESTAFGRLLAKPSNAVLGRYLGRVLAYLASLDLDWMNEYSGFDGSQQQNITRDTASLRRNEVTLENWCRANTGVS
jgi:hypothetical protein